MFEARLHPLDHCTPEIVSAFGVHSGVSDYRKLVRDRGDEDQDGVPQRRLVHFEPREASTGRMKRVVRLASTDEDAYLPACSFFGGGNGRHNSVVIDSLEEMMRFHNSRFELPAAACAATAAVTSATGKSATPTPSTGVSAAASPSSADPPDTAGPARS
jgi:hypothetical protein